MALDSSPNSLYRALALTGVDTATVMRGDGVPLLDLVDPEVIEEVRKELARRAQEVFDQVGDDWHQNDEIEGTF